MPTSFDLLNPGYKPPPGATLNEWGYWIMPDGNLAPGQNTPGSQGFTPVDATGNYAAGNVPAQYTDPNWGPAGTGTQAFAGVPGSPTVPGAPDTTKKTGITTGSTTTGSGSNTVGNLLSPFTGSYQFSPVGSGVGPTPVFTPPTYTKPDAFKAPSIEEARNDPGFLLGLNESLRGMEQSAAARGTLNTGGTLKDLINYGRNAADQQYNQVLNRNLGIYGTNVQTQNVQPFQFAYQSALDQFAPQMLAYSTNAAANQRAGEFNATQAWNQYLQQYAQYRNQKLDNAGIITNWAQI